MDSPVVLFSILGVVTGVVLILRGPIGRAAARRIEGDTGGSPELEARISDLEARLAAGEHERAELAERVDFTERLVLEAKDRAKGIPR